MAIKDLFKKIGNDPTMGFADSKTARKLSESLNLGNVADNMNVNSVADVIRDAQLTGVIKYEGNNDTFIWKHPI